MGASHSKLNCRSKKSKERKKQLQIEKNRKVFKISFLLKCEIK
jgi:hypothetical protein